MYHNLSLPFIKTHSHHFQSIFSEIQEFHFTTILLANAPKGILSTQE